MGVAGQAPCPSSLRPLVAPSLLVALGWVDPSCRGTVQIPGLWAMGTGRMVEETEGLQGPQMMKKNSRTGENIVISFWRGIRGPEQ